MSASFIAGSSASLKPGGIARYFAAVFLSVWLAGWLLGEVFAAGFLILLMRSVLGSVADWSWPIPGGDWIAGGAAGFVFLFVLIWLALWTFGGVAGSPCCFAAWPERIWCQRSHRASRSRAAPDRSVECARSSALTSAGSDCAITTRPW